MVLELAILEVELVVVHVCKIVIGVHDACKELAKVQLAAKPSYCRVIVEGPTFNSI